MVGYTIRRILALIPLLLAVVTVTFFLMHAVQGGPFDSDRPLNEATRARLEEKYNLDGSLGEQYVHYMRNLANADLGVSFSNDRPVRAIIADRFPVSLHLGLYAFAFAITSGLVLGIVAALHQNGRWDYVTVFLSTVGAALPPFILAPFLVWTFALKLDWFNVLSSDYGPISVTDWSWVWHDMTHLQQMVLPTVALGFLPAAFIARVTRASMLEVLRQDYIRTARSKGLDHFQVVMRHAIRNALIPVLTIAGPIFAGLITGSFIIERAFSIPGLGRSFIESVINRDYGVIMGTTVFFAVIISVMNLIVDLTYAIVDPRIRL